MAKTYSQRPSQILFPRERNPNVQLWVDNFIFDMGAKDEARIEALKDKHETELKSKMFELALKVIKAVLGRR